MSKRSMPRLHTRISLETRALIEFVLIPGLAAVLPWRLCFRLFRWIARWPWLYREHTHAAHAVAARHVAIADRHDWAWRFRLCLLIDHSDFWLSRFRSDRWLAKFLDIERSALLSGPSLVLFFHSGPGMWPARALCQDGRRASFLSAPLQPRSMGGSRIGHRYGRARLAELARVTGLPITFPPGAREQCRKILARGDSVLGMPDVPPDETRHLVTVPMFNRRGRFPGGLIATATATSTPIMLLDFPPDLDQGRRRLVVVECFMPGRGDPTPDIVAHWQRIVLQRSWSFTLWPMFDSFLEPDPGTPEPSAGDRPGPPSATQ